MDGGIEKINPLDEQELSGRSPVCALRERSNGRGFEFPEVRIKICCSLTDSDSRLSGLSA